MSGSFWDTFGPEEPDSPEPQPPPVAAARRRGFPTLTVVALVLLAAGVGLLGWVGYQYFGTNLVSERAFQQETAQLRARWQSSGGSAGHHGTTPAKEKVVPGDAIGLLRVPRFGADFEVPILAGTDLPILSRGVGHYEGTAMPGQVGNFAVAGHRITHGQPFARLLDLKKGDQVLVETRDAIYTYVLDEPPRNLTVRDTDTWVIDPVPGQPAAKPTKKLLTLTTCQDLFRSPDRSVGFGHLASTKIK